MFLNKKLTQPYIYFLRQEQSVSTIKIKFTFDCIILVVLSILAQNKEILQS